LGLKDSIRDYFNHHPRAKKALGVATAIASNFTLIVTGSSLLAAAAGTIVDHRQNQEKLDPDQLMDFFKQAIQEPEVQDSIKQAVREGGADVASHVSTAMNQLGVYSPDTGQFVSVMKSDLSIIARELGIIRDMISYYEIPDSRERVMNVWRLPAYLDDVIVLDTGRKSVIDLAIKNIRNEENVVILGAPGSGKTTIMYAIWNQLNKDTDTALVWDTADISREHEKNGIILFTDDLPETRKLAKTIAQRDVKGVVTTAREQDWSRLPLEIREKFKTISLPNLADKIMKEITINHLSSQNVEFDNDAIDVIVSNAQGSPIYVRYITEEIGVDYRTGKLTKLIADRASRAPKGMTNYVADILARVLFDLRGTIYTPRDGALPVIKALLCLADMPNYETHEVHLNQMFFISKHQSDGPGPFNAIKQYLSRDPRFFSLKFMHDTLADVLRGGVSHPIVGDIRMIAQEMGVAGRKKLEKQALKEGWDHVKEEYQVDNSGGLEPLLAYSYFAAKNFGVGEIDEMVLQLASEHIESPLSQGLFAITGPITEVPKQDVKPEISVSEPKHELKEEKSIPGAIGQLIRDKVKEAVGEDVIKDLEATLGNIPQDFSKMTTDSIRPMISKFIEGRIGGENDKVSNIDKLEEMIAQEDVDTKSLARVLRKVARTVTILDKKGNLEGKERYAEVMKSGLEILSRSDPMMFTKVREDTGKGLSIIIGKNETKQFLKSISL